MPRWPKFEPRFWSLVNKSGDCWLWTGNKLKGYGRVHFRGKRQGAHRVAWILTNGEIPPGLFLCHRCDNKLCCRPTHLFTGTQKDNMQDWTRKGKNRLVNDRSLWANGKHWKGNKELRKRYSERVQQEIQTGKRIVLRDKKTGQIRGTQCV